MANDFQKFEEGDEEFQKFQGVGGKQQTPRVAIRSNGQICFLRQAVGQFHIKNYDYAILWPTREGDQLGIQLTNEEDDAAYEINYNASGEFTIAVTDFLRTAELGHEKTRRYEVVNFINEKNMMVVDLDSE